MNEQIRISPVRVINTEGELLGVMPTGKAMEAAREAGLDLVEVAPNERPPVCKIMDFGKFKYSQKKKASKQKQHQVQVKEIRVRPKTGDHDIEVKVKRAREFLEHKDKVLVNVLFRGRELAHIDEGRKVMMEVLAALEDVAKVEKNPSMEGKRMTAIIAPRGVMVGGVRFLSSLRSIRHADLIDDEFHLQLASANVTQRRLDPWSILKASSGGEDRQILKGQKRSSG